jgi:5'-deoxynucleotidase YfbR-like HD superfamily hydrolase
MRRKAQHTGTNLILFPPADTSEHAADTSAAAHSNVESNESTKQLDHNDSLGIEIENLNALMCGNDLVSPYKLDKAFSPLKDLGFNLISSIPNPPEVASEEDRQFEESKGLLLHHLESLKRARFVWLYAPTGNVNSNAALELGFAHAHGVPVFCDIELKDPSLRPLVNFVKSPRDFFSSISKHKNASADSKVLISQESEADPAISLKDVKDDIDVMLWSMKLYALRRFFRQRFWEVESEESRYAERIEASPRLESVAEHSWHVADTVSLLAGHFASVNAEHSISLAIIHDKMEIITGDKNPIGRDGKGLSTHAFNDAKRMKKDEGERAAMTKYLLQLRRSAANEQKKILLEMIEISTPEARFVKAVDKMQPLAFILLKKKGDLTDAHLDFTLKYARKALSYFPGLRHHFEELQSRLFQQVAQKRGCHISDLNRIVGDHQLSLYAE